MNDTKNITIGLLCVSAAILVTLAVIIQTGEPAGAVGVSATGGEYIMFTGQVTSSTDMLYVVDLTKKKLNAYHFDTKKNAIMLKDQVDLGKAFREAKAGK